MDTAFGEELAGLEGVPSRELLSDLRLSQMGRSSPSVRAVPGGSDGWQIEVVSKPAVKPAAMPPIDWQMVNIERWDCNLRYVLQRIDADSCGGEGLRGALELARELIRLLRHFRPGRTTALQDYDAQKDSRTRPQQRAYCELCWRLSMRSKRLRELELYGRNEDVLRERIKVGRLSNRYCSVHLPGSSKYHADLRYKSAFNRQLDVLTGKAASEYAFNLRPPMASSIEELRKTAYEQVHSRLHPVGSGAPTDLGLREKIWLMRREGISQSEMARRLGISRQAVSKAKKDLEWIVNANHSGCHLNDLTGEVIINPELMREIDRLVGLGVPIAKIAREVRLTKSTVDDVARRLNDAQGH